MLWGPYTSRNCKHNGLSSINIVEHSMIRKGYLAAMMKKSLQTIIRNKSMILCILFLSSSSCFDAKQWPAVARRLEFGLRCKFISCIAG